MAKTKEKKNYVVESADGKLTIRMLTKGTDGLAHSVVVALPSVHYVDGKLVKMSRKQVVSEALKSMAIYYK